MSLLLLLLCAACVQGDIFSADISLSQSTSSDHCDLTVNVDSMIYPATRGKTGALACFANQFNSNDGFSSQWNEKKTYPGFIAYGEVPEDERRTWQVSENETLIDFQFRQVEAHYDTRFSKWHWRDKPNFDAEIVSRTAKYSFQEDEFYAFGKIHKSSLNPLFKWGPNMN